MQVFTRRVNEGLVIGDCIHVTVIDLFEDHVRLAISSPNEQPSYWEETLYVEQLESTPELQLN